METWEKEYNKMAELNEFFGLPYDEHTDSLIKDFIHQSFTDYKEEVENACLDKIEELQKYYNDNVNDSETLNETAFAIAQIKDILNKIN